MDSLEEDVIIERLFGAKKAGGGENLTKSESGRESAKKSQRGRRKHLPLKKVMWRGKSFTKAKCWGVFCVWGLLLSTHA